MRKILVLSLIVIMLLTSGCAVQDYLKGYDANKSYSLLTEKEDVEEVEDLDDLDELIEDLIGEENITEEVVEEVIDEEIDETTDEEVDDDSFIKISVKENEMVKLRPKAVDADEDTITYTFSEPLNENGEWETSYGDAGNYLITVTASDGQVVTSKKVLLAVERVNVAPVIEGLESIVNVEEGDTLKLLPKVSDPNGDLVTVTISEPVGDDGLWKIDYQEHGSYDVNIKATDGELETVKSIELIVKKKNVPPTIDKIADIEIEEGEKIEVEPVVNDLNGDDITVTISEPIGDDGVWETGFTDHGVYEVTVEATDGVATTIQTFQILVNDVNKAPEIIDILVE